MPRYYTITVKRLVHTKQRAPNAWTAYALVDFSGQYGGIGATEQAALDDWAHKNKAEPYGKKPND